MKRQLCFIMFFFLLCNCTEAQSDSSFNLRLALSDMMKLEQEYSEIKDVGNATELILLYEKISKHDCDTTDYYNLARCRMLAEVHRYDEAISLTDSLTDEDKTLFKERICLMKDSYENDTSGFNSHLNCKNLCVSDVVCLEDDFFDTIVFSNDSIIFFGNSDTVMTITNNFLFDSEIGTSFRERLTVFLLNIPTTSQKKTENDLNILKLGNLLL